MGNYEQIVNTSMPLSYQRIGLCVRECPLRPDARYIHHFSLHDADAETKYRPYMLTKWERKGKKVRWAKLVPVCWLIQGLLSATLRKYNITENSIFLFCEILFRAEIVSVSVIL